MRELARELLAGQEAWVVGGAVRDELLGRELVDLDIAVREPEGAARAYAKRSGGASFPLSERHGAWRVALEGGRTVDFTPFTGAIETSRSTPSRSLWPAAMRSIRSRDATTSTRGSSGPSRRRCSPTTRCA
jgi:tRNA nucleotidyltransferase/poly(A) polymerase